MKMKVYLFDFGGTVCDTLGMAVEIYNGIFERRGMELRFSEASLRELFNANFHDGLAELIPDEELREAILSERSEVYTERVTDFRLFEGMGELIGGLSEAGSVYIISSNDSEWLRKILQVNRVEGISEILGGDVEKSKAVKFGWMKEKYPNAKIFYIGDTTGDMVEGKDSGVKTVGVTWGFHAREMLEDAGADEIVESVTQLEDLLFAE